MTYHEKAEADENVDDRIRYVEGGWIARVLGELVQNRVDRGILLAKGLGRL